MKPADWQTVFGGKLSRGSHASPAYLAKRSARPVRFYVELVANELLRRRPNNGPEQCRAADFPVRQACSGETKTAQVYVDGHAAGLSFGYEPQNFGILRFRDKFDVKIEPVEPSALPNKLAKRGYRVTVAAKDGLPVGRFHSWLTLHTNLPDAAKLDIPIVGQVVGDISVIGSIGWNPEESVLTIAASRAAKAGRGRCRLSCADQARRILSLL